MTKEATIKFMVSRGWVYLNYVTVRPSGYPDSQFLKDGKSVFIEFKKDKDTVKPLQKFRIDDLNKWGFTAFAIHEERGIIYPSYLNLNLEALL